MLSKTFWGIPVESVDGSVCYCRLESRCIWSSVERIGIQDSKDLRDPERLRI